MSLTLFTLNENQYNRAVDFINVHDCKYRNEDTGFSHVGAIGGSSTYSFTATSLGIVAVVTCACGVSLDLTDYESW